MTQTPELLQLRLQLCRRIRICLGVVMAGLILSGITAFPLVRESAFLVKHLAAPDSLVASRLPGLATWLERVHLGLAETDARFPFLAYGTDWLAFAHLIIALAFVGPWRHPVRNLWIIEWGLLACVLVLPTAAVCGALRGIPWYWRVIDASFGILGATPLALARSSALRLAALDRPAG